MATYTSGTSATTYQPFITGAGQLTTNFDPLTDFGYGPTSPNGNVYFYVTNISGRAKGYDGTSTVTMFVGGSSTAASSIGTSTSGGTSVTTASYATVGGSISTVVREGTTWYGGYDTNSAGGLYSTRSTGNSGYNVYASGSASFTSSQVYFTLTYSPMPDSSTITASATATGQTTVSVSWSSVSGASGYEVSYSGNGGASWNIAGTTGSTSYSVSGLTAGTAYQFRVAAYISGAYNINTAYKGPYSGIGYATTQAAVTWDGGNFASGTVGVSYYSALRAAGASSITFAGGSYPPGLSGYQSGDYWVITGTPTGSGNYSITLTADGVSSGSRSITIAPPNQPSFSSTSFANGKDGNPYGSSTINVYDASGLQSITTSVGSVAGLSISTTATSVSLSGTPVTNLPNSQTYSFSATAYGFTDNGSPNNTTTTLYVTIDPKSPPVWTDQVVSTSFTVGTPYSDAVAATNSPTYSVSSGSLPSGVSINSSTGEVSGTPTTKQSFSFALRAANNDGSVTSSTFTGTTVAPPVWIDTTLGPIYQGRSYSDGVSATSPISASPTVYTVSAGQLPTGLSINASTGAITGTTNSSGAYSFTISATNSDGAISSPYSGTIILAPNWTDNILSGFVFNVPYSNGVLATNSPTYSVSSGSLPTGISLNTSSGAVTGTPTDPVGTAYSFTISATNTQGFVSQAFSGQINPDLGGKFKVYSGTQWIDGEPYIYDGTGWVLGKVYTYDNGDWIKTVY